MPWQHSTALSQKGVPKYFLSSAHSPVGICGSPWHFLKPDGTEVVVVAVVDESHVWPPEAFLELFQGHACSHPDRTSTPHRLVEVVGLPADVKVVTQSLKPSIKGLKILPLFSHAKWAIAVETVGWNPTTTVYTAIQQHLFQHSMTSTFVPTCFNDLKFMISDKCELWGAKGGETKFWTRVIVYEW